MYHYILGVVRVEPVKPVQNIDLQLGSLAILVNVLNDLQRYPLWPT